jgi:hypothetical protein
MGPGGFEPTPKTPRKTHISAQGGALSGARGGARLLPEDTGDPDLQQLIDAWPTLPEAVKAGIMAMIRSACPERT